MDQPSILRKDLWQEQQERLIALLTFAIMLLVEGDPLPVGPEPEITRRFKQYCDKARFELDKKGCDLVGSLHWEEPNLAQYTDVSIPVGKVKEPDCQYTFYDQQASSFEEYERSLVIECKRLGRFSDSSHTRELNQNYVRDGICRFHEDGYSYGKDAPCGIMIGYVQNMEFDDILTKVNAECRHRHITELALSSNGWQPGLVSHLSHSFVRSFPITPFALRHIWADLRRHYNSGSN